MNIRVLPGTVAGMTVANPSKSAMQRAVAAALLCDGHTTIYNPGFSKDCLAALDVAERLGAEVVTQEDRVDIRSHGVHPRIETIHCGESGLGIRMFTPIAALSDQPLRIEGHGSLVSRPMGFFEQVLPQLGVKCSTHDGKLPLAIQGPMNPRDIEIDGSLSSQFLTGLLMAFGAAAEHATIRVINLKSKPYIELTLQLMQHFGVRVEQENYEYFRFRGRQKYRACEYNVEGDWSGAAFLLVAAAISGQVEVENLSGRSAQSDKAILQALEMSGASVMPGMFTVRVEQNRLKGFDLDATDCPDLFPPLVALAACSEGVSRFKGVSRLAHKESDRGIVLQEEFGKLGIRITLDGDEMCVHGGAIHAATVHSHNDHRIAMACAVAALRADGPVDILAAEAVEKSYPEFWDHMRKIGVQLS